MWFTDQNTKRLDKTNVTLVNIYNIKSNALFSSTKRWNIYETLWIFVFCQKYG